jgi:hypothetical protein
MWRISSPRDSGTKLVVSGSKRSQWSEPSDIDQLCQQQHDDPLTHDHLPRWKSPLTSASGKQRLALICISSATSRPNSRVADYVSNRRHGRVM